MNIKYFGKSPSPPPAVASCNAGSGAPARGTSDCYKCLRASALLNRFCIPSAECPPVRLPIEWSLGVKVFAF